MLTNHNIFKATNFNGNKKTDVEEFLKHWEQVCDNVNWTGLETLLLKTPSDYFKGWSKTNFTQYEVGNVFKRSVNGVSVKFITRAKVTEEQVATITEPWDAPDNFTPIQYNTDTQLNYIPCNWVENEYLVRNCQRICPIDGNTWRYNYDVIEQSKVAPSVAAGLDNKEWKIVTTTEETL